MTGTRCPLTDRTTRRGSSRPEKIAKSLDEHVVFLHFTFPDHVHFPPKTSKPRAVRNIPLPIPPQLRLPIPAVGPRPVSSLTVRVLVPKTSVDEDNLPPAWKNHVRTTRQVVPVQAVSVSHVVNQTPNSHLGLHSLTQNRAHVGPPHVRVNSVQIYLLSATRPIQQWH